VPPKVLFRIREALAGEIDAQLESCCRSHELLKHALAVDVTIVLRSSFIEEMEFVQHLAFPFQSHFLALICVQSSKLRAFALLAPSFHCYIS